MPRFAAALALALVSLPAASCGLVDPDVTDFNLKLPEKAFNVDTADWMLTVSGDTMPALECPMVDCTAAAATFCAEGRCTSDCGAGGTCQARVKVSVSQPFDLANESPELETIDAQAAIRVTVDKITFAVSENTLNVPSPPLAVYLAPMGVLDSASAEAVHVGTVAEVEPGTVGDVPIAFTPAGRKAMEAFMSDFRTPFTVIVAGDVVIAGGAPVPRGKLSGVVSVAAHAGL